MESAARWMESAARWIGPKVRWIGQEGRWIGPEVRWMGPTARWIGPAARWIGPDTRWMGPTACWIEAEPRGFDPQALWMGFPAAAARPRVLIGGTEIGSGFVNWLLAGCARWSCPQAVCLRGRLRKWSHRVPRPERTSNSACGGALTAALALWIMRASEPEAPAGSRQSF